MANKVVHAMLIALTLTLVTSVALALPPDLEDDLFTGTEDSPVAGNVLDNDDPDDGSNTLTVVSSTPPASGGFTLTPTGDMNYAPVGNFSGVVTFGYTAREDDPVCFSSPPPDCFRSEVGTIFLAPRADLPTMSVSGTAGDEDTSIPLGIGIVENDPDSEVVTIVVGNLPTGSVITPGTDLGDGTYSLSAAEIVSAALIPPLDWNGTFMVGLAITSVDSALDEDGSLVQDSVVGAANFAVTVNIVNDDPFIATAIPGINTVEDVNAGVDLAGVVDDGDILTNGDSLSYVVTSINNTAVDTAIMSGTVLNITVLPNQVDASGSVTVQVSDSFGGVPVNLVVPVVVAPVNDDPVATGFIPVFATDEDVDGTIDLDGVVSDVDILTNGDVLSYAVTAIGNTAVASASMAGTVLSVSVAADQNQVGGSITVQVEDSFGGTPVIVVIPVDVRPINDDPYQDTGIPSLDTFEDTPAGVDLAGVVADVDIATNGDSLSYAITSVANAAVDVASISGSTLSVTLLAEMFASGSISVQVTDSAGGIPVDLVVPVNVVEVNDDPFATGFVPSLSTLEDVSASVDLDGIVDDADVLTNGDSFTYAITSIDNTAVTSASLSGTLLFIVVTADQNQVGGSITIQVSDSFGGVPVDVVIPVDVTPVNDPPILVGSLGNRNIDEDDPPELVPLTGVFDDVDILTNADMLTYEVSNNTNPGVFSSVTIVADVLTLTLVPDANGVADISIIARDLAGSASPAETFTVTINGVDDLPLAADDVLTSVAEDSGDLRIDVLTNDYLGDVPTVITAISVATHDVLDINGDIIVTPNGTVVIDGSELVFTPTADFWGDATFQYTIRDSNGDEDTANVIFNVDPVNDAPEGQQAHYYSVFEGATLTVDAVQGLLVGSYDIDPSLVDSSGNPVAAQPLSIIFETQPPPGEGTLLTTASDGSFTFLSTPGFVGTTSFTYSVFDNTLRSAVGTVSIEVLMLPPAGMAPNPGEVAVVFNLANTPLEQSATVSPNVLVTMDDSGSMDWHLSIDSTDDNGRFVINNSSIATSSTEERLYTYLFDLNVNSYSNTSSCCGRILPSQESLPAGNDYQVWQARSSAFNGIYYNPEVTYSPWTGLDNANVDFDDADELAIRLDPVSASNTFNILTLKSYTASSVPRWQTGGGSADIAVSNFYIPRYYTATGTRIDITAVNAPFTGGDERDDCAGTSNTCTYAEEIKNFANWFQYYRSRELVAKASIGNVVAELQDIRVGYETINRRSDEAIAEMNEYYWEGEKKELLDTIYTVNSSGGTPLRRALDDAGQVLGCTRAGRTCPSLPAPEGICQQNFSLLFSDGYWNGSASLTGNYDQDGLGIFDGGKYADTFSDTLADIAMFYYENDLFPAVIDGVPLATADINGVPVGTYTSSNDVIHQHMKTFTIAFGVEPDIDPDTAEQALATASFAWPSPTSAPNAKIDDMLHAAINGRGRFLNAGDPQDLQSAVGTAFLEFTQAASSTSAAAFNSTSLREGTLLYRGFYDLRNRTGELSATEVSTAGVISSTPTWTAAQLLDADNPAGLTPSERVLVTYDPISNAGIAFSYNDLTTAQQVTLSENQVNFMRGERTFEEPSGSLRARLDDEGLLGDIVNSSPVFVGEPRAINRDQNPFPINDLYSDFVSSISGRQAMVYVGANDGMLHGFNASTGTEIMGYIPNMILDSTLPYSNKLNAFTSAFYLHDYFVDLSPRLNDVYMRPSTSSSKQWMTTLLGGLGAGGKGYFALNVTDPGSLFASENSAKGAVLWEFTDDDDTYPNDLAGDPIGGSVGAIVDPNGDPVKDLGYSLSLPVITMSNALDTDSNNHWVAIFGNGTNSTSGIATLFVLFMDKGLNGWASNDFVKITTGFGVPLAGEPLEGYPNALGSPTAVDRNLDGTVDLVYAGDRLGNLFRFDLEDSNSGNWSVTRLFTASYDDSGTDTIQPILSRPLVVKHPDQNGFLITFGTGSFIAEEDGSDTSIQSIYTIWDQLVTNPPTAAADSKTTRLVQQTITNVVDDSLSPAQTRRIQSNNAVTYTPETAVPGVYGWYIDLDMVRAANTLGGVPNTDISGQAPPDPQFPGEKAIRRFLFRDGVILTTTVLPATDATSCFGSRPGALLIFDGLTGGDPGAAIIDFNLDGYVDAADLLDVNGQNFAAGLVFDFTQLDGQLVDLSTLGGTGDTDFLFICGGNDCITRRIRDLNDAKTGRLSWSEMQAD